MVQRVFMRLRISETKIGEENEKVQECGGGVYCITCAGAGERQVYRIERNVTGGGAAKHCVYSVERIPGISLH